MKRSFCFFSIIFALVLCACGQNTTQDAPTWQEQYDLGMRYLSEGNYEEAIIAFTAAIEIDPKQAPAYVGRGGAYIGLGETEENLSAAQADYETAIELDETLAEAHLGLADVYIRRGEYDKALEILRQGLEKTEDQAIADKIKEMESGTITDSSKNVRRNNTYDLDGTMIRYTEYDYDQRGRRIGWKNYSRSTGDNGEYTGEFILQNYCQVTFDDQINLPERNQFYNSDGTAAEYDSFVYNENRLKSEQYRYQSDGEMMCYFLFYYNDAGQEIRYEGYNPDGSMYNYWISEYDDAGNFVREVMYDPKTNQPTEYSVEN